MNKPIVLVARPRVCVRTCRWRVFALAVWSVGTVFQTPALAQADSGVMCEAPQPFPDERTDWYDAEGDFIRDTTPLSSATLAQKFAGSYRLLVVTSEGSLEKVIAEYKLDLAVPTAAQAEEARRIPAAAAGKLVVPLVATMEFRRGATGRKMTAGRPWPDIAGKSNFEYWPARGKLGFNLGIGIDAGTLFDITDVEADGSFRGRWTDGGLTVMQLDTPVGPVLEKERGYFCGLARRS